MGSFIFTILIWLLVIPEFLIENEFIRIAILIIQLILLIAQIIYAFYQFKNKEGGKVMFAKTLIRQGKEIIRLNKENKALYEENKENRFELVELEDYKKKNEKLKKDLIIDLVNLQEINRLGIAEKEKDKHRNVIINKLIKELSDSMQKNR